MQLRKISALLFIPFCGFYMTPIVGVSPIYFFFIFSLLLLLLILCLEKNITIHRTIITSTFLFLFFLISQVLVNADRNTLMNVLFSISSYVLAIFLIKKLKTNYLITLCNKLLNFSILLFTIDAIVRFSFPSSAQGFYKYKFNGILFPDTNFLALNVACLFFFTFVLEKLVGNSYSKYRRVLFILLILTISRAAIIIVVLFCILLFLKRKIGFLKTLLFSTSLGLLFVYLVYFMIKDDPSFLSKFYILEEAYLAYTNKISLLQNLIGVGFGNTTNYLSYGAHNILVTYALESGLFGLIAIISYWIYLAKESNYLILYILIPFILIGFSLSAHAAPYLYVMFSIIIVLNDKKNRNNV